GAEMAVLEGVAHRERALPDVAAVLPARGELVAPGVAGLVQTSASGLLPLRLARQPHPAPGREGLRVPQRHVHHRMIATTLERGARSLGRIPARALDRPPPGRAGRLPTRAPQLRAEQPAEHERPAELL